MKFFTVLALIAFVQVSKAQDISPSNVLLKILNDINTGNSGSLVASLVNLITNDLINLELYPGIVKSNAADIFENALSTAVGSAVKGLAPPPAAKLAQGTSAKTPAGRIPSRSASPPAAAHQPARNEPYYGPAPAAK